MNHRCLIHSVLLAATVVGSACAPVWAQDATPPARPVRIDVGLLLPTDGSVRSRTGSTHFAIGGSLDVLTKPQYAVSLYADGSLLNESSKAMNMASGGVLYRSHLSPGGAYAGLGVGAYYLDYKDTHIDGNKFGPGGKVFAGFDFLIGAFVEANYTLAPEVKGRSQDNVQLLVGYRF